VRTPVSVGVVCGPGGPGLELARGFDELPQACLRWICDDGKRTSSIGYGPATAWTTDFDELLQDEDLDAIAFASSELAGRGRIVAALTAEKHVFVHGTLASSSAEADELLELAAKCGRRLMANASTLLRPEVLRLHRLVQRGLLGEVYYVHAKRLTLSPDASGSVLRTHGLDVVGLLLDVLGDEPVEVLAHGESYLGGATPDTVFGRLSFATGISAYLHLSTIDGESVDRLTIVGSRATAIVDGGGPEHALTIWAHEETAAGELSVDVGDRVVYGFPPADGLRAGCTRFVTAIRSNGDLPLAREASAALAVVEALEASALRQGAAESVSRRVVTGPNVIALHGR
jgi:predicted dehydrogenase